MRTLSILMIIFIFTGCNPCKRLQRKCPVKDSVSYVETIRFDTITLVSPADTLIFRIPVERDLNDLIIDVNDKPGPSVKIRIKDQILTAEIVCPEDSLKAIINSLQTELNKQKTIYKEVPGPEVVRNSKFARIAIIFSLCCVILLVVYVYLKIKGGAVKSVLNRFR